MCLCSHCLDQICIRWYPNAIGYNINVATFGLDMEDWDSYSPSFKVASKGTIEVAYFPVAKTYMLKQSRDP